MGLGIAYTICLILYSAAWNRENRVSFVCESVVWREAGKAVVKAPVPPREAFPASSRCRHKAPVGSVSITRRSLAGCILFSSARQLDGS